MTKLPDLRTFLPGRAKEELSRFFTARLVELGVYENSGNPIYGIHEVIKDVKDQSEWVKKNSHQIFDDALEAFEKNHPLEWSNELQRSWRRGINDPKAL